MEVKKATTYREQVEKNEQRGCCIENVDEAIRCLESINYYRLSAYFHAHKYSPVGYLDASIYSRSHKHQKFLDMFNREVEHSSKIPFVKHHQDCYNGVFPIWVAVEFCIRIPKNGTKNFSRQLRPCLKSIRRPFS
ncbi:Abi family protein [Fibrobacter sp.]|uniref:Abi family protein n=1 Tax=Fibrobacter sp. TaxID=35828 RepID=UPI00388D19D2